MAGYYLTELLAGVEVLIHAAARAHIVRDEVADPLAGTAALMRKARLGWRVRLWRQG